MSSARDLHLGIIGLGYVGLALAVECARRRVVVGFDIDAVRIEALRAGRDATLEGDEAELRAASGLRFTSNPADLAACNVYIVIVPTPIVAHERPDLWPLLRASGTVGHVLGKGDIVIDESTVCPGATEEDCVPGLADVKSLLDAQALARAGISAWRL